MKLKWEYILIYMIIFWEFFFRLFYLNYFGYVVYFSLYFLFLFLYGIKNWGKMFIIAAIIIFLITFAIEEKNLYMRNVYGNYAYSGLLGPKILDVPVFISLAWIIFIFVVYNASSVYTNKKTRLILYSTFLLVSLDLILDPVGVATKYWTWVGYEPNGLSMESWFGIPWKNYLGWFLAGIVMFTILSKLIKPRKDFNGFLLLYIAQVISWAVLGLKFNLYLPIILSLMII